jgi:hypothetical protein
VYVASCCVPLDGDCLGGGGGGGQGTKFGFLLCVWFRRYVVIFGLFDYIRSSMGVLLLWLITSCDLNNSAEILVSLAVKF